MRRQSSRRHGRKARGSRAVLGALTCVLALSLAQCKDDPIAPEVVTEDAIISITSTNAAAIEGVTFTFPNGGAAISPQLANQTITVTMTNTASGTPTTTVVAPNLTGTDGQPARFTARTTFGSCTFVVQTSTYPPGTGPQVGNTITVNPCRINAQTGGIQATGQATVVNILLQLGLTPSAAQQANVSINPQNGQVSVNNVNTGQTVTLSPLT